MAFKDDLKLAFVAALKAHAALEEVKQVGRFDANLLRLDANQIDAQVDQAVEEYNEIQPILFDYEPVAPEGANNIDNEDK